MYRQPISSAYAIATICIASMLASCEVLNDCRSVKFDALAETNRIRISTNHDKTLRETRDTEEIQALLRFLSGRRDNWCQPWYGSPIGKVRANLYKDEKFLGSISVGPNFMGGGMWLSRRITVAEREQLIGILNVPDPDRQ